MLNGRSLDQKSGPSALGTFLLWALMAVLGVLCILALRELVLSIYVLSLDSVPSYGDLALLAPQGYNQAYWRGISLTQWTTFLLAILYIGIVIGGAEFLFHNYGRPKAWKFLGWALGLELVGLILAILI